MKAKKSKKESEESFGTGNPGVCYVGHIPRGFHEDAMRKYFAQFGKINKLRIARSKKTGEPKGYGFIEFDNDGVAQVAADAMNNYLMFHKLLKCQFLPLTKVHPKTFKGCQREFKKPTGYVRARIRHNASMGGNKKKHNKKTSKQLEKLAALGVDFSYPGLVDVSNGQVKQNTEEPTVELDMDAIEEEAIELLNKSSDSEEEEEAPQAKRARKSSPVKSPQQLTPKAAKETKVTTKDKKTPKAEKQTPVAKKTPKTDKTLKAEKQTPVSKKTPKTEKTPKAEKQTPVAKKTPKTDKTPKTEKQTPVAKKTPKDKSTPKIQAEKQTPKTLEKSLKSAEKQKKTPIKSASKKRKSMN